MLTETKQHQYCNDALKLKKNIEHDFIALGGMLFKIQNERYYEAGWDSWEDYTMELKMSQSTISKLIRIYKIFHIQYGIPEAKLAAVGGWSVVAEYLPMVTPHTTKEQVAEWLGDAASLTQVDARRTVVEARKGTDMTKCKHKNAYKLEVCPDCGDRWKI